MKKHKVKDWYQKITHKAETVQADAGIQEVLHAVRRDMKSRTVFVLDDQQRLKGAIPMRILLRIMGSQFVQRDALSLMHEIMASKAEDMAEQCASVTLEDDLETALKKMVQSDQEDMPVVDAQGHVLGELNCFEVVEGYLAD